MSPQPLACRLAPKELSAAEEVPAGGAVCTGSSQSWWHRTVRLAQNSELCHFSTIPKGINVTLDG